MMCLFSIFIFNIVLVVIDSIFHTFLIFNVFVKTRYNRNICFDLFLFSLFSREADRRVLFFFLRVAEVDLFDLALRLPRDGDDCVQGLS